MLNISSNRINKALSRDQYYILQTLRTPNLGRILARWLIGIGFVFFLASFLPWQQNIRGYGKLTAFEPGGRPQTVETAIAGRISSWHVREGEMVKQGDTIITLTEIKEKYFDPLLLQRMEEQVEAKEKSIESKRDKAEALRMQIKALTQAREVKLQQAKNKLSQARYKLKSDSVDYQAEKIRFANIENQFERNQQLYEAGNIALTKLQDIQSKFQEGKMKLISSENKYNVSQAELANAIVDITGVQAEYGDKLSKATSDLTSTLADVYDAEVSLAKTRNERANMVIRNEQYKITAPQSGRIVKALKAGIGETIKEGEAVVTIMPEIHDMAVEMYVKAMDVPLIDSGRHVRIEFDGWPALQFAGWPSVSVGTFGGEVRVVDYVNSEGGMFRILVTPDPDDEPWPEQLRFGSGTKGWVMLETVPVWFEIWRQLNGFPPSLYENPTGKGEYTADPSAYGGGAKSDKGGKNGKK